MINESRAAFILSVVAVIATGIQAWYAYKGDALNNEKITIEAESFDNPSLRVGATMCLREGVTSIDLRWRVTIFNNSAQPVTIKELESVSTSAGGIMAHTLISVDGPPPRQFPVVIDAQSFKSFDVTLPTIASEEFGHWLKQNGGCDGKPIWPSKLARLRFSDTGWTSGGNVGGMFTAVSGSGKRYFIQALWR